MVPWSGVLLRLIVPLCSSIISFVMLSPSPELFSSLPGRGREKNFSKTLVIAYSGMPAPLSVTVRLIVSFCMVAFMVIFPFVGVNSTAFLEHNSMPVASLCLHQMLSRQYILQPQRLLMFLHFSVLG